LYKAAPDACVGVFPSDHFVSDDREFMRHVDLAFDAVGSRPEMIAVLGDHAARRGARIWLDRARRTRLQARTVVPRASVLGKTS
jgi:hypothetical protein